MPWEFRILGGVEAYVDGRRVDLGHARQRCVLAALLVDVNRPVSLDQLLARVWAERPPVEARQGLYSYLSRLRQALSSGDAGDPVGICREVGGYVLTAAPEAVDLHRFRRLVARARESGDDRVAYELLKQAIELWRGEPAAGLVSPWLDELRATLEAERLAVWLHRNDVLLRLGLHARLLNELAAQAAALPLDERLAGQLMLAQYRSGRPAEALAHYRRTRQRLADELGIEPAPPLQLLHRQILAADHSLDLSPAQDRSTPPQARVADPVTRPRQLPAAISSFIGRDDELARLDRLLARTDGGALAVVTGTAGVGKTALAVQWAHRVHDRFPDGQLYLSLRGNHANRPAEPAAVLAHALHALGVPRDRVPVDTDAAASLYRSVLAGRRVLVLLDDAARAEQVRPLLPVAGCLVMVTSREELAGLVARDDAYRLPLGVLPTEEAHLLVGRLIGADRVAAERDATAELVKRCARLPLALRIAAANLAGRDQSIREYVLRLSSADPLGALDVGGDREAAVRSAFDVSYDRLPPAARRLFRLLGLVPGPDATAEAAAVLADLPVDEAAALLRRLAAAHLLDERPAGRYGFHDLLRAYAGDRLRGEDPPAEIDAARDRLHAYYLAAAQAAADLLSPRLTRLPVPMEPDTTVAGTPAEALRWLDAERANLIAAITHTSAHGPHRVAVHLADILRGYLWLRIGVADWQAAADAALAAAEAGGDPAGQAAARLSLALLHWRRDEYPAAIRHATFGLDLARRAGWHEGESAALGNLGSLHQRAGHLRAAVAFHRHAMAVDRRLGRTGDQAANHSNLGVTYQDLGRMRAAADEFGHALTLYRLAGDVRNEPTILLNLGISYRWLGRLADAVENLTTALARAREAGSREVEAFALINLAGVHRAWGRHAGALDLAHTALAIGRDTGSGRIEADALVAVAGTRLRLGDHARGVEGYESALAVVAGSENRITETDAHVGLAAARRGLGELREASSHARRALKLARSAGYHLHEGRALTALAAIALDQSDPVRAGENARAALEVHRATGYRLGEARTLLLLGRARDAAGAATEARSHWREALAVFDAVGAAEAEAVRALLLPRA